MAKGTVASATITAKGQITIPKEVREVMDLKEGDSVVFIVEDGKAYLHAFRHRGDLMSLAGIAKSHIPYRGKKAEREAFIQHFVERERKRLRSMR